MSKSYDRYFNDKGQIAVLYSPGYGAGWSTWNSEIGQQMCEDKRLVEASLKKLTAKEVYSLCQTIFDYKFICTLGWPCEITWMSPREQYKISEYDGYESIETKENTDWFIAGVAV
jgi:hypothetical protein